MADKPQSALAIRKAALKEAKTAYDAKLKQLKQEREALIKQARESRAMVKESQEVALESTQRTASLMQTVTQQNSRAAVGSTIFLSSVAATAVGLAANQGVLWLAKPGAGDQQPNFVARNRGFFEALPGFLFGGGLGLWTVVRAGDSEMSYGAGDEFLRQTSASLLTVGMIRGGDALLSPLPPGIR